jgi:uncharacterized membrane protein YqjE
MDKVKEAIFKFLRLDNLMDHLSGYVETRLELYKMEIREDVAKVLSRTVFYGTMGLVGFLFLIFLSLGLAHFLNRFFSNPDAGFWIVAAIYGVAFLIFLVFRESIRKNFERHFIEMTKRKHK